MKFETLQAFRVDSRRQIAAIEAEILEQEIAYAAIHAGLRKGDKITWVHMKALRTGIVMEVIAAPHPKTGLEDDFRLMVQNIKRDGTLGDVVPLYKSTMAELKVIESVPPEGYSNPKLAAATEVLRQEVVSAS